MARAPRKLRHLVDRRDFRELAAAVAGLLLELAGGRCGRFLASLIARGVRSYAGRVLSVFSRLLIVAIIR